jgi:hypothetical protein
VSHWNYRVVQSFDQTEFFIAEVYYDDDAPRGWVDSGCDGLRWDDYDHLRGSVEMIQKAFDKPLLRWSKVTVWSRLLQLDLSGRYRRRLDIKMVARTRRRSHVVGDKSRDMSA